MQLTDVRTRVRERLGLSTTDTAVTDAILTQLINAAHRKINLIHDWPWLHKTDATWTATVAGQATYTFAADLASDWRKTLYIVSDTDQVLVPKQKQDLLRYSGQNGYPVFYAAEGSEILLAPTPDAVYTIVHEYIYEPADVTSDSTEFVIYDWAIELLIEGAAVLTAKRLRDPDLARELQQEYALTLKTMEDEVRRTRQLPTPRHRSDIGWP